MIMITAAKANMPARLPEIFCVYSLCLELTELFYYYGLILFMRNAEPCIVRGFHAHGAFALLYRPAYGHGEEILIFHGIRFKPLGYVMAEAFIEYIEYAV